MADYRKEGRYGMAGCGKESMLWQVVERKVWHGSLRKLRYGMAFFLERQVLYGRLLKWRNGVAGCGNNGIVWQVVKRQFLYGRLLWYILQQKT